MYCFSTVFLEIYIYTFSACCSPVCTGDFTRIDHSECTLFWDPYDQLEQGKMDLETSPESKNLSLRNVSQHKTFIILENGTVVNHEDLQCSLLIMSTFSAWGYLWKHELAGAAKFRKITCPKSTVTNQFDFHDVFSFVKAPLSYQANNAR